MAKEFSIYNKCKIVDFKSIFERKGYTYFTHGNYNLNIIGVRNTGLKYKLTNKFDDIIVVIFNNGRGETKCIYEATTDPGSYYMKKELLNKKGCAILVPGQYRGCWQLGKHNGKYDALVQSKPIKIYRDGNKDDVFDLDPKTIQEGYFGINIHRSDPYKALDTIDKYSAGCQVFKYPEQFRSFINICKKQKDLYGNSFTYTLITEDDLYV